MIYILNNNRYFENLCEIISKTLNWPMTNVANDDNKTYLIFNAKDISMPTKYIMYNFEQLDTTNTFEESFWSKFHNAIKVFDYSHINIAFLKAKNIDATFAPYGWNVLMKNKVIEPFNTRINNVMFLGYLNDRRINILKPVHKLCKDKDYTMFLDNNCWSKEYDEMVKITKIGLNIHFYGGNTILEVHRIIPYILNKVYVVSERSQDPYYDNMMDGLVTWLNDLHDIDKIIEETLLIDPIIMERLLTNRQRLLIERCPMSTTIELLEKID